MTFQTSIRLAVLLLGMSLVAAMTFWQAIDNDLGIVRLRYVAIVGRDYDEALNWYTKVLGLEKIRKRVIVIDSLIESSTPTTRVSPETQNDSPFLLLLL